MITITIPRSIYNGNCIYCKPISHDGVFSGRVLANNGEFTLLNGKLHSYDDEPAVIKKDVYVWYKNGKIHRDKKPAYIKNKNSIKFYQNGKLHRDNAPAVYDKNGTKKWYFKNKLHRLDGPAIEYANGDYTLYMYGKLCRSSMYSSNILILFFIVSIIFYG